MLMIVRYESYTPVNNLRLRSETYIFQHSFEIVSENFFLVFALKIPHVLVGGHTELSMLPKAEAKQEFYLLKKKN